MKSKTEKELYEALKIALKALNVVPNTVLGGKYKSTYNVCSMIEKVISKVDNNCSSKQLPCKHKEIRRLESDSCKFDCEMEICVDCGEETHPCQYSNC